MLGAVEEHTRYIADRARTEAYRRALRAVVTPGDVVLDLGCGTGLLGLLALEAGAARVYSVDCSRMATVAERVARGAGLSERIHILRGHSTEVDLPERADVVVADQMAPFGVGAGLVESFADARARHLRPGARMVPHALTLWLGLVEAPRSRQAIDAWSQINAPGDFRSMRELAGNQVRWVSPEHVQPLGEAACYTRIDLSADEPSKLSEEVAWRASRAGRADGMLAYFHAALGGDAHLTNAPGARERVDRDVLLLPFDHPLDINPEDALSLRVHVNPADMLMGWQVRRTTPTGSQTLVKQSNLGSMVLDHGDLDRSALGHQPGLSEHGLAQRCVLNACDGMATTQDIARQVRAEHPRLFHSEEAARRFVAAVLGRCSR